MNMKRLLTVLTAACSTVSIGIGIGAHIEHGYTTLKLCDLISSEELSTKQHYSIIRLTERGVQIPYIVLKNGYHGNSNTLVMRKEPLPLPFKYCGIDYDTSGLREYLSTKFKRSLGLAEFMNIQKIVVNEEIPVLEDVFMLSADEMGLSNQKDKIIPYFNNRNRRIAKLLGQPVPCWTDTPTKAIDCSGKLITVDKDTALYVRPAFVLYSKMPVKTVYNNKTAKYEYRLSDIYQ